jgi:WD40 repeat protein
VTHTPALFMSAVTHTDHNYSSNIAMDIEIEATGAYGHGSRVFDLAFHPKDPNLLASCSEDGSARVWRYLSRSGDWEQVRTSLATGPICDMRRCAAALPQLLL